MSTKVVAFRETANVTAVGVKGNDKLNLMQGRRNRRIPTKLLVKNLTGHGSVRVPRTEIVDHNSFKIYSSKKIDKSRS